MTSPFPPVAAALLLIASGCATSGRAVPRPTGGRGIVLEPGSASSGPSAGSAGGSSISAEEGGLPVHGSIWTRYRGRRTSDEEDHDLFATLALDVGDREQNPFTGHFLGRLWWDVGGDGETFAGLENTYDSDLSGKLYHAYVDAHDIESLEVLRLGRQQLWETPEIVVFDGVRAEARDIGPGLDVGLYGGVPAHFYESSPAGDAVLGVYGQGRPWEGGRVRLDWMYLEDEARLGDHENDLLGLGLWQLLGDEFAVEVGYTRLEGRNRDARLIANFMDDDSDLTLQVSFYSLLEEQKNYALEADPFYGSLKGYAPYDQLGLLASKSLFDGLSLDLGADFRRLEDEGDEGEFNHEFEHYFVNAVLPELGVEGLVVTLSGDSWEDDQQDVWNWGADLTQTIDSRHRCSLGTYYSFYKYDLFLDSERDDVRSYYAKLRYDRTESQTFTFGFEHEDDDFEEYQTLRLGVRWLF